MLDHGAADSATASAENLPPRGMVPAI